MARLDVPGSYVTANGASSPHMSLSRHNGSSSSNILELNHSQTNSVHKRAQSVNNHNNLENNYNFPPLKNDLLGDLS